MSRPKIVFLSSHNPFTTKAWSGIPFSLFESLKKNYEVEYVPLPHFKSLKLVGYYFARILHAITGKLYVFDYGIVIARLYGWVGRRRLKNKLAKFIFSPAGLTEVAFLNTKLPIVSYGDCSTLQLVDYYPALGDVIGFSKKEIRVVERRALERIEYAIFSSAWASDFVERTYRRKTFTIPFGSNIDSSIDGVKLSRVREPIKLLWIGVDWNRKGGDIVYETFNRMRAKGLECQLTIIGVNAPIEPDYSVKVIPRLQKDIPSDLTILIEAYSEAHFLLLPTRADCTPIVIAEAFAHGLPVLATRTGGVPSMVQDAKTGFLLDLNADQYVNVIERLTCDWSAYLQMCQNCLAAYQETFNWEVWGDQLNQVVKI